MFGGMAILIMTGVIFNESKVTDDMKLMKPVSKVLPNPEYNSVYENVSMLNNTGGI
jgi:hypothetical protein